MRHLIKKIWVSVVLQYVDVATMNNMFSGLTSFKPHSDPFHLLWVFQPRMSFLHLSPHPLSLLAVFFSPWSCLLGTKSVYWDHLIPFPVFPILSAFASQPYRTRNRWECGWAEKKWNWKGWWLRRRLEWLTFGREWGWNQALWSNPIPMHCYVTTIWYYVY